MSMEGKRHTEDTKRRMKEAHAGIAFSDERKQRMKEAALRRWQREREPKDAAA